MPDRPLVSVVVPAFNAEATLEATLRSAAAQTWRHFEIIIVDDGSTDSTVEVARRFCESEPRSRLLSTGNRGAAAARNSGIAASRGEFVAFLDSDDLWHPQKLEKQVAIALSDPAIGLVYSFYDCVDVQGNSIPGPQQFEVNGAAFWRHLYWNFVGSASGIFASRAALLELGGFPESLRQGEDVVLQLQLAARYRIACVPDVLMSYRQMEPSLSSDPEKMFEAWVEGVRMLRQGGYLSDSRVTSWTLSRARWGLAIRRLRRRDAVGAAAWLLRAFYEDPARTLLNAARALAGVARADRSHWGERLTDRLDSSRMRRLAARDERAARRPGEGAGRQDGLAARLWESRLS